jgi:hypothetical protein
MVSFICWRIDFASSMQDSEKEAASCNYVLPLNASNMDSFWTAGHLVTLERGELRILE